MFNQQEFYALEEGKPLRLVVDWGFLSREIIIYLDSEEIGRIPRAKLSKPHEFILSDGCRLKIQQVPSIKILGMGFQPYLHISLDGRDLPGVIVSPQQLVSSANGAIFLIALAKLVLAILMPVKTIMRLPALQFREIVEWQQSFTGSIFTGLILLGLFLLPQRFTRQRLTAALVIILGNFLMEFSCLWVCKSAHISSMAAFEGLAALSIFQGLRAESRSRRRS